LAFAYSFARSSSSFVGVVRLTPVSRSGFFVVPMNVLLQHRGHVLMSAGHSIAVQNFNENLFIIGMLVVYLLKLKRTGMHE
jgi:hypothetical protein